MQTKHTKDYRAGMSRLLRLLETPDRWKNLEAREQALLRAISTSLSPVQLQYLRGYYLETLTIWQLAVRHDRNQSTISRMLNKAERKVEGVRRVADVMVEKEQPCTTL